MYKHKSSGFTLIELLVVIAIIALLSSTVMSSLSSARAKSRDATRAATLRSLQAALEMYYNDNNAYPNTSLSWRGAVTFGVWGTGATGYIPGLVPTYISKLPLDPLGTGDGYLYISNGTDYKLLSHVSPESYPTNSALYDSVRPTWAWQVSSSPAAATTW